jgi:hypothetical protein
VECSPTPYSWFYSLFSLFHYRNEDAADGLTNVPSLTGVGHLLNARFFSVIG